MSLTLGVRTPESSTQKCGRKGDKIQAVKTLQACLDVFGYGLAIDGSFGGKTETALKDFQKKHGLTVDGVCGKNSWNALLK